MLKSINSSPRNPKAHKRDYWSFERKTYTWWSHKSSYSWNSADFTWNPVDFMWIKRHSLPTALHKTEEFLLSYLIYKVFRWISQNLLDFTWNLADFMWIKRHSLTTALHKTEEFLLSYLIYKVFRWISRNLPDFMWNPPDFERPIARNGNAYVSNMFYLAAWDGFVKVRRTS